MCNGSTSLHSLLGGVMVKDLGAVTEADVAVGNGFCINGGLRKQLTACFVTSSASGMIHALNRSGWAMCCWEHDDGQIEIIVAEKYKRMFSGSDLYAARETLQRARCQLRKAGPATEEETRSYTLLKIGVIKMLLDGKPVILPTSSN